jgi:hypothetical protein
VVNLTSIPRYYPDVAAEGCGIQVRSIPEATEIIRRCVTDSSYVSSFEPAMARFRRCYYSAVGPEAAEQAVNEIASLVKGRSH